MEGILGMHFIQLSGTFRVWALTYALGPYLKGQGHTRH